jgi:HD superfamily phosphohydrolase
MNVGKVFNDPIHGHIELSPLCIKIIDTPQFQRLRDISQLGGVYYVFPGASSKRFEHSVGVGHLSKTFIEQIRMNQPELNITDEDVLCIEIAGLCHDLGHGPFSHCFDAKVLPKLGVTKFNHEHASIGILDILIEENSLMNEFNKYGLNEDDIHFIKELILGSKKEGPPGFQWKGRGEKTFLYDIVANKRNGIDVDKFDYFSRDCHGLNIPKSFDSYRLMRMARVFLVCNQDENELNLGNNLLSNEFSDNDSNNVKKNGELQICYHVKEAWNLFELFHTRFSLHKRAYQHKVSSAIELMIAESLVLANPYILVPGLNNEPKKMSDCTTDYHAYWRLGEYIFRQIENSFSEELKPSRDLILRIRKRDLFICVAEMLLTPDQYNRVIGGNKRLQSDIEEINNKRIQECLEKEKCNSKKNDRLENKFLEKECIQTDIFCTIVKLGFGKGGKDPVTEMTTFYKPDKDIPYNSSEVKMNIGVVPSGLLL